jgi:hypothetical protein
MKLLDRLRYLKRRFEFRGIKPDDFILFVYYNENGWLSLTSGRFIRINSNGSFYITDIFYEKIKNENYNVKVFDKTTRIVKIEKNPL